MCAIEQSLPSHRYMNSSVVSFFTPRVLSQTNSNLNFKNDFVVPTESDPHMHYAHFQPEPRHDRETVPCADRRSAGKPAAGVRVQRPPREEVDPRVQLAEKTNLQSAT